MLTDRSAIVDASSLINLAASGVVHELMQELSERVLVCTYVKERECLYLRTADGAGTEAIDVQRWISDGILQQCELEGEEQDEFVNFAARIDDGEAMCFAIASSRQLVIVTDDRKGRRMATEAGLTVFTTAQIVRSWGDSHKPLEVANVIRSIEERARFKPPENDPEYEWWSNARATEPD